MNKQDFLVQLRKGLSGLPQDDIEERLTFYSEMIDDRMEEGLSEEDAVSGIGSVDAIISQIVADIPITKLVKEKMTPKKRLKAWEVVLLVLGCPVWLSLLIAAFSVILSLYAAWWCVIISLWIVFGSVIVCAVGGIVSGIVFALKGNCLTGIAMLGACFVCAGSSVFLFYVCKAATKATLLFTKKIALNFIKKEKA